MPYPGFRRGPSGGSAGHVPGTGKLRYISLASAANGNLITPVPGNVTWRILALAIPATVDIASNDPAYCFLTLRDATGTPYYFNSTIGGIGRGNSALFSFTCINNAAIFQSGAGAGSSIGDYAYILAGGTIRVSSFLAAPPAAFGPGLMLVEEWQD